MHIPTYTSSSSCRVRSAEKKKAAAFWTVRYTAVQTGERNDFDVRMFIPFARPLCAGPVQPRACVHVYKKRTECVDCVEALLRDRTRTKVPYGAWCEVVVNRLHQFSARLCLAVMRRLQFSRRKRLESFATVFTCIMQYFPAVCFGVASHRTTDSGAQASLENACGCNYTFCSDRIEYGGTDFTPR